MAEFELVVGVDSNQESITLVRLLDEPLVGTMVEILTVDVTEDSEIQFTYNIYERGLRNPPDELIDKAVEEIVYVILENTDDS